MEKVLVTGGTGFVGSHLTPILKDAGYEVVHLSRGRKKPSGASVYQWDVENGWIEDGALDGVDHIIHLAGAGVMDKRWTPSYKEKILNSRVHSAELLNQAIRSGVEPPSSFISASAIGFYGARTVDHVFKEDDPPYDDFLGHVVSEWEAAVEKNSNICRTVELRTGMVLDEDEGALPQIARPIKLGFGAPLGNGKQYMPWIHIRDLCNMFLHALQNEDLQGPYNAVAPEHVTNKEFTQNLAKVLGKPLILPKVPGWVLKMVLGEKGAVVLEGSRVSCEKIRNSGFEFEFNDLEKALRDLYLRS